MTPKSTNTVIENGWSHAEIKSKNRKKLTERLSLSRKKIKDMSPDELLDNAKLIDEEITTRGIGMLFG